MKSESDIWEKYIKNLGEDWKEYLTGHAGDDWKVFVNNDSGDAILCEKFAGYLGGDGRIERIAYFDHGWVVTKRDARVSPRGMRALLDAWE
jgi:hypothetical protein